MFNEINALVRYVQSKIPHDAAPDMFYDPFIQRTCFYVSAGVSLFLSATLAPAPDPAIRAFYYLLLFPVAWTIGGTASKYYFQGRRSRSRRFTNRFWVIYGCCLFGSFTVFIKGFIEGCVVLFITVPGLNYYIAQRLIGQAVPEDEGTGIADYDEVLGRYDQPPVIEAPTPTSTPPRAAVSGSSHTQQDSSSSQQDAPISRNNGVYFAGANISLKDAVRNFLFVSAVGGGKSIQIYRILASLALGRHPDRRAVIYDPAKEVRGVLRHVGVPAEKIRILNPYDRRACALDLPGLFDTETRTYRLGELLAPAIAQAGDDTWRKVVVLSVRSMAMLFNNAARRARAVPRWGLRDIILGLDNPELMRRLLESDRQLRNAAIRLLGQQGQRSGNLSHSIMFSLEEKLSLYKPIAALWEHHAREGRLINLNVWTDSNEVLLLGRDLDAETQVNAINTLIINHLTSYLLDVKPTREIPVAETFFVIDEFGNLPRMDKLPTLFSEGRRKGICSILGFQVIGQLEATWGKETTGTILGQFNFAFIGRLACPHTAEWASQKSGQVAMMRVNTSESHDATGIPTGTGKQQTTSTENLIKTSAFLSIPPMNLESRIPLSGLFFMDNYKFPLGYAPDVILKGLGTIESDQNFVRVPIEWEELEPWSQEDLQRLHLDVSLLEAEMETQMETESFLVDASEEWGRYLEDEEGNEDSDLRGIR